ncbi:MAG: hypothetical protein AVDCRST_MAG85-288, partial [uncultured Solirubrobacteraceae bacterium]
GLESVRPTEAAGPPDDRPRRVALRGAHGRAARRARRRRPARRGRGDAARLGAHDGPRVRPSRRLGGRPAAGRGGRERRDGVAVARRRPRRRGLRERGAAHGRRGGAAGRAGGVRAVGRRRAGAAAVAAAQGAGHRGLDGVAARRGARPAPGRRRRRRRARPAARHRDLADRARRLGQVVARADARRAPRRGRRLHGRERGLPDARRRVLRPRVGGRVRVPDATGDGHVPPRRRRAGLLADPAGAARRGPPRDRPVGQRGDLRRRCAVPRARPGARHGRGLHAALRVPRRDRQGHRPRGRRHPPQRAGRLPGGRPGRRGSSSRLRVDAL